MTITEQDFIELFRNGTTEQINNAITRLTEQHGERECERVYASALKKFDRETEAEDGPIHDFFGLSYCDHLVLPRVLLQSMPHSWQARLVALLEEYDTAFAHVEKPSCYDITAAEDVYANELTETQMKLTGVTSEWSDEQDREIYWDRDGNEIEGWTHIAVPVPDPLPPYSRGRTRVPRADQLAQTGGE